MMNVALARSKLKIRHAQVTHALRKDLPERQRLAEVTTSLGKGCYDFWRDDRRCGFREVAYFDIDRKESRRHGSEAPDDLCDVSARDSSRRRGTLGVGKG